MGPTPSDDRGDDALLIAVSRMRDTLDAYAMAATEAGRPRQAARALDWVREHVEEFLMTGERLTRSITPEGMLERLRKAARKERP